MVTVLARILHAPLAVMRGTVLALLVAVTMNDEPYAADAGAPVNVTVGVAMLIVMLPVAVFPRKTPVVAYVAVS